MMTEQELCEKRNAPRSENRIPGTIHQEGNRRPMPCTVEDYSRTGAKLTAEKINRIPDTFNLHFDKSDIVLDCIVVWRNRQSVGGYDRECFYQMLAATRKLSPEAQTQLKPDKADLGAMLVRPETAPKSTRPLTSVVSSPSSAPEVGS